jgi:hypothetical protein
MIYVDTPRFFPSDSQIAKNEWQRYGNQWSHLWCDEGDEEKLHKLASEIGLRREWFQDKPHFPHYDLVPSKQKLAIEHGAKEKSLRTWIMEDRKMRTRLRKVRKFYGFPTRTK